MRCWDGIVGVARPFSQYFSCERIVIPDLLIGLDRNLAINICGSIDMLVSQKIGIKTFVKIDVIYGLFCFLVDNRHDIKVIAVIVESTVIDLIVRRLLIPAFGLDDIVLVVRTRQFLIQVLNSFIGICA